MPQYGLIKHNIIILDLKAVGQCLTSHTFLSLLLPQSYQILTHSQLSGRQACLATPGCRAAAMAQVMLLRRRQVYRCLLMRVTQMQWGKMGKLVGNTKHYCKAQRLGVEWKRGRNRRRWARNIVDWVQFKIITMLDSVGYYQFGSLSLCYGLGMIIILSLMSHSKKNSKHPPPETEIQNLPLIEQEVHKRFTNPQESTYCQCSICLANYQLKQRGKAFLRQTSSNMKLQPTKMQDFLSLVTAVNSKVFMKLDIPEICFFSKGEPRKLFKSNNSGVHRVELTPVVKKNLANVFLDSRRNNLDANKNKNRQTSLSFLTGASKDTHIKNFSAVIPSYKHGQNIETKKPQTYIFHNDRNYTEDINLSTNRSQSEQICILKSRDKGLELINEKQLRQTMKSLLYLQNVEYIQTYIKPNDKQDQIFEATYVSTKGPQNQLMYNRSLAQVKIDINLINKFSKDYVSLEELQRYENILKQIPQEHCLYQTYKMVHYMQLTKDVTIDSIGTLWLRDQCDELCFFGLSAFEWYQNEKISVDIGQIHELKQLMKSELTDFEQELMSAWEHMKSRKCKPSEKPPVDVVREQKIEEIKKESTMRLAKEKEKESTKRIRKQSEVIDKDKTHLLSTQ